jgi:hypothetical protein
VQDAGVFRLLQVRHREARRAHGRHQVHVEIDQPGFVVLAETVTGRVVDQHVEAAKRARRVGDPVFDLACIGKIASASVQPGSVCAGVLGQRVQSFFPARAHCNLRAVFEKSQRDCTPDALAATSQCDAIAGEIER